MLKGALTIFVALVIRAILLLGLYYTNYKLSFSIIFPVRVFLMNELSNSLTTTASCSLALAQFDNHTLVFFGYSTI